MEPHEDTVWVRQAQAGDHSAFARLVERYWSRVFRWLYGVTGCAHRTEDLTQEVFCKAWQSLDRYQAGNFRAWLFRIAANALIDGRRRQRSAAERAVEELPGKEAEPLAELVVRENEALLAEACRKLPEPFRAAFLLWSQEGFSYADMADALGVTEETARWRVFRARRWLVKALGSQLDVHQP